MTRATITAIFRGADEVTIALERLKTAKHEFDQASEMVGAMIKPAYSYGAQQIVWKKLTFWTVFGAFVGGTVSYLLAATDPTFQIPLFRQVIQFVHASQPLVMFGAVMAYSIVGASVGQLIGGLLDVVLGGSLDEGKVEDVSAYTLSVQADDFEGEAELKQIFAECGCLQVETNAAA